MSENERSKKGFSLSFGRVALILAALVALLAVALSIMRSRAPSPDEAPPSATGQPEPDVATMIAALEQKLAKNPGDGEGWTMLGWSYYSVGRYADAVKAYGRATTIDPANPGAWSALGEVLVLAGPGGITADAAGAFRKALALDPKDFRARYFLGVKKDQDGDHQAALDDWIALLNDAPPGAPWEDAVRALIDKASSDHGIDVAGRVPPRRPVDRAAPPAAAPGAAVATDGIPGPTASDMQAASGLAPADQDAMVRGMVDRLAARLQANPKDGDGWIRLMRARIVLKDGAGASAALAGGRAAFAGDSAELARLDEAARALGMPAR